MSMLRSEITLNKRSWILMGWNKVVDLFANTEAAVSQCKEGCNGFQDSETMILRKQAVSISDYALCDLLPKAGQYQQILVEYVLSASTVYSPEEAQIIFDEQGRIIEDIEDQICDIRTDISKLHEVCDRANVEDLNQPKKVSFSLSVSPLLADLKTKINNLEYKINYVKP